MSGVAAMLAEARRSLGWGEPNPIHKWYGDRNGSYFARGSTPWCNMSITYWAYRSGNYDAVCHGTDYAFTPWHADRFRKHGEWYSGTSANVRRAKPGDIVFFDWGGTNTVGRIDHVGIVEKNLGDGRVQTIEGNTRNRCLRRVRSASTIAGYGRPQYAPYRWDGKAPDGSPILRDGSRGSDVRDLQNALMELGYKLPKYSDDGDFGDETGDALGDFQRAHGLKADEEYGPKTAAKMRDALAARADKDKTADDGDQDQEDDVPYIFGQLDRGENALTSVSYHPGAMKAVGFLADNGRLALPPVRLRVAVHYNDASWAVHRVTADSTKDKPWVSLKPNSEGALADGFSVQRELPDEASTDAPAGYWGCSVGYDAEGTSS